ncbi:MAG: hypothetical protein KC910_05225 [Candidatus Eremiobacteraeota bacterium]|nr:hypothetical protein [Candidatus Eremiobacteraeota bacterium]
MKRLWLLLLWLGCSLTVWARPMAEPVTHIILLDVSGSLRERGYAVRVKDAGTQWEPTIPQLLVHLFAPDGKYFASNDMIIVQPFSDAATDVKERRAPFGPLALAELPARLGELPTPGAGATDMARALDLARQHVDQTPAKTVLTWVITDNENNLSGNQSDALFYERLRSSPDYSHVFFFPLADPTSGRKDALVMYLLAQAQEGDSLPWMDELVDEIHQRTGYEGVLFRPLYNKAGESVLKFDRELVYEGGTATQEGGATVLTVNEGDRIRGQLKFKIHSNLKGWEIVDATMEDATVKLDVPRPYRRAGTVTVNSKVTPRTLSIKPNETSLNFYVLSLQDSSLELERSTWDMLKSPFARWLPQVEGKVKVKVVLDLNQTSLEEGSIRPALSDQMRERVKYVPNLDAIEFFMIYQPDQDGAQTESNQRVIEFERNLVIKVRASNFPRVLMTVLLIGLLGFAALLFWMFVLWRVSYRLEAPEGNHELNLPALFGSYLIVSPTGLPLAKLALRFGSPSLVPEPEVNLDGDQTSVPVEFEGSEFRFELSPAFKEGESHFYVLHRAYRDGSGGPADDIPEL